MGIELTMKNIDLFDNYEKLWIQLDKDMDKWKRLVFIFWTYSSCNDEYIAEDNVLFTDHPNN